MALDNVTPVSPNAGFVGGSNGQDLLLATWAGEVLNAYDRYNVFESLVTSRSIESGRSIEFPVTGRVGVVEAWEAGVALEGGGAPTGKFSIELDERPVAAHFELDNIEQLVSQFEYRSEMARQCGQALARTRDTQLGHLLVKAAGTAARQLDESGIDTSYAGQVVDSADYAGLSSGNSEEKALAFLQAIEGELVRRQEIDVDTSDLHLIVNPADFHAIRRLGVADSASDIASGQMPLFGNQFMGTSGNPDMLAGLTIRDSLSYMGAKIIATNNLPTTDRSSSGDANYRVDASNTTGLLFSPDAVASVKKMDLAMDTFRDVRRNTEFVVAQMFCGAGVLRPELAVQVKSA